MENHYKLNAALNKEVLSLLLKQFTVQG